MQFSSHFGVQKWLKLRPPRTLHPCRSCGPELCLHHTSQLVCAAARSQDCPSGALLGRMEDAVSDCDQACLRAILPCLRRSSERLVMTIFTFRGVHLDMLLMSRKLPWSHKLRLVFAAKLGAQKAGLEIRVA